MSQNQKFVIWILVISIVVVCTAVFASGGLAIGLAIFISALVWMLRPLVMPAGYGVNKIRMACLLGAIALTASVQGWSAVLGATVASAVSSKNLEWLPAWAKKLDFNVTTPISVLVFYALVVLMVFYFTRDRTITGNGSAPLKDDFPEENFEKRLKAFCSILRNDLVTLDRQSNWNPEHYAELEAEVEVLSSHGVATRKKVLNLQEAIKVDRKLQSFLLLGVPGAGKSVALRKLALDMMDEVNATKRIPIYINLREWVPKRVVDSGRISFDFRDLKSFVLASITKDDDFLESFANEYFTRLWHAGRLFFIFDSFDEISELLDTGQDEEVVDALSRVISRFIGDHPESKGILASRIFRRPTQSFLAQKVLEIRPLSEASVLHGLSRFASFTRERGVTLFSERRDLVPLVRNPFMMALLGDWVKDNAGLPDNQAQIYEGYILKRLKRREQRLHEAGVTIAEFMSLSTEIAWFVFTISSYGLEAPVKDISGHFGSKKIDLVISTLRGIRIARVTTGDEQSFAFVHRRFLEYFVTRRLLENPNEAPISDIPTDSRGRDALVLYAQICQPDEAERIARLCWDEIKGSFDVESQRIRAIHCLRFLVDAFCSRRSAVKSFEGELHRFIGEHVQGGDSLVMAKICLEATGLLPEAETMPLLSLALSGGNEWLQETAFRACRHLPRVEPALENVIISYVLAIPDVRFWRARKGILLSLSLSEALKGVGTIAQLRVRNQQISFVAAIALLTLSPLLFLFSIMNAAVMGLTGRNDVFREITEVIHERELLGSEKISKRIANSVFDSTYWADLPVFIRLMIFAVFWVFAGLNIFAFSSSRHNSLVCIYPICSEYSALHLVICLLLTVLILDYLFVSRGVRSLLKLAVTKNFWFISSATAVILGLVGGFIAILIYWLSAYERYVIGAMSLLVGAACAFQLVRWLKEIARMFKDRKTVARQIFAGNVVRAEIARVMGELLTDYGRRLYVRRLEVDRVGVTGEWPAEFKLSVGKESSITALARLEERWLGLDR
ncbi:MULTISPECIES: NACHT domain-containing protein [Pseudomonas]|uniref:NACHT domain-containing protein n=1 Tax=Pseudomonas TaxID=286 RepID=UPI0013796337|nr:MULTISPECIES: NACHT domain-containing protein [Pseudomonas]WBM34223.1 NACHT domain-containing protein [Pseudomonas sp. NY11382]